MNLLTELARFRSTFSNTNVSSSVVINLPGGHCSLETIVRPQDANHSYSGIMFNVGSKTIDDVQIISFTISGNIGDLTVYCAKDWRNISKTDPSCWEVVGNISVRKKRRELTTITLNKCVIIPSNELATFYIHSTDLGDGAVCYQSYSSHNTHPIKDDKNLMLYIGCARCGSQPFDNYSGWWRGRRGFAGNIVYKVIKKIWCEKTHQLFPRAFREIVLLLLMARSREDCILYLLPKETLMLVIQSLEWDCFGRDNFDCSNQNEIDDGDYDGWW